MRKYWHVLNIGLQNTLVYRLNFLFRATFSLIPLTATIFVWRAIYEGKPGGKVATYELAQMISYYLVITIVDALTAVTEDDWQIAADIKDGHISQFLTRPLDYLHYRFCLFVAGRAVYTLAAAVPVILVIQVALLLGMGLACAAVNVFFRDVRSLLVLGLQLWFYASPVIYPITLVPERLRSLYFLNPMAGIITAFRDVLLDGRMPGDYLLTAALVSSVILVTGYLLFKRVEFKFADIV